MTRTIYKFAILLIAQCASVSTISTAQKLDFQIVYTVDKVGLFLYDLRTETVKNIYPTDQVFIEGGMEFLNDSMLVIGHQSKARIEKIERLVDSEYLFRPTADSIFTTDNLRHKVYESHLYLTETFFSLNLNNGSHYKFKVLDYEQIQHTKLKIKTSYFDSIGNEKNKHDTTLFCSRMSVSNTGIKFCDFERFFSKSEIVNGRQVFSKHGDLYLTNQLDTTLLLKFKGHFDPRLGNGYYRPAISPDGKRVSFEYLAGSQVKGSAIYEMDIDTKEKKQLIGEGYFNPVYSPNGQKVLISKNQRSSKGRTWINTLYILDIETGKTIRIGNGNEYLWRPT